MSDVNSQRESVVERIWKKQAVPDEEVFAAFWDLDDEGDARAYIRSRWFKGRRVTENHITRKLNRIWPKLEEGLQRSRRRMREDATVRKVFKVENYKLYPSTLGYIAAYTQSEARTRFDIIIPQFESEGTRYVEIYKVLPADRVDDEVMALNSDAIKSVSHRLDETKSSVAKHQAIVDQLQLRMDALGIFMTMQGGEDAAPAEEDTVTADKPSAEEVPLEVAF